MQTGLYLIILIEKVLTLEVDMNELGFGDENGLTIIQIEQK
jgi:hypothetical protein